MFSFFLKIHLNYVIFKNGNEFSESWGRVFFFVGCQGKATFNIFRSKYKVKLACSHFCFYLFIFCLYIKNDLYILSFFRKNFCCCLSSLFMPLFSLICLLACFSFLQENAVICLFLLAYTYVYIRKFPASKRGTWCVCACCNRGQFEVIKKGMFFCCWKLNWNSVGMETGIKSVLKREKCWNTRVEFLNGKALQKVRNKHLINWFYLAYWNESSAFFWFEILPFSF